jgi:hypothetical protein
MWNQAWDSVMKRFSLYILALFFLFSVAAAERLIFPGAVGGISGVFPAQPVSQRIQNDPGTVTDALIAIMPGRGGGENGSVFHFLGQSRMLDGQQVIRLGADFPYRVARQSSASGAVSATVFSASEEYNLDTYPSMIFELNLKYQGMSGKGYYWASVKDGKTFQAYTWCIGSSVSICKSHHDEFLKTVRY